MKHHWLKIIYLLIVISMGIFYWYFFCKSPLKLIVVEQSQLASRDGMICINNLMMPRLQLSKEVALNIQVQESTLSATSPLIVCHTVTGSVMNKGVASGIFKTTQMIFNRDQKTLALPEAIETTFCEMTIWGDDAFYDIPKKSGGIKKNVRGQHVLFNFDAGTMTIDTEQQMVMLDDGVKTEFFLSRKR